MTIEEVEELRKQELNDELRFPELQIERRQINQVLLIREFIYRAVNNKLFVSRMLNRLRLKKMGFEISGKGTDENPYVLKSYLGEGKFFNVKYLFRSRRCPFKVGLCFSNAFNIASEMYKLENVDNCDCVSGISLVQGNNKWRKILHSVVELNNKWVVDVNCGMVISNDLYYKLFMFEELARVSGEDASTMYEILETQKLKDVVRKFNLKSYHMVFAKDDLIDFIENYSRQEGHQQFADLNY